MAVEQLKRDRWSREEAINVSPSVRAMAACSVVADAKWSHETEDRGWGRSGGKQEEGVRWEKKETVWQQCWGGRGRGAQCLICSSLICLGTLSHLGPGLQSILHILMEWERKAGQAQDTHTCTHTQPMEAISSDNYYYFLIILVACWTLHRSEKLANLSRQVCQSK